MPDIHFWKVKVLAYLSSVLIYRWYALGVAWAVCLIGWTVVALMPDEYRAEARVYIETQNLMDPLLGGITVSVDPTQEIAMVFNSLITRPTLQQVVGLTHPNAESLTDIELEGRVQELFDNISIGSLDTENYFSIGYNDSDRQTATSVTQTLLTIVQNNRIGGSRLDMDQARSFIDNQITNYEERLRDADKRRADYRTAHVDILGRGLASTRIDQAAVAHDQAVRELNAAIARRNSLRAQLGQTPETVSMDERMFSGGVITGGVALPGGGNSATTTDPMQRLQQARTEIDELRTRYTERHPDVVARRNLIARIEALLASDSTGGATGVIVPNPAYTLLQTNLSNEETSIAALRQRVSAEAAELSRSRDDASRAIDIQAEFAGLDRDYSNIERTYQELLSSREAAYLSQARDDQNQGVSFRVLEPPQAPQNPSSPNRILMNSSVLFFGFAGGVALAIFITLYSGRILTSDMLTSRFGIPLIGVITQSSQTSAASVDKRSMIVFSAAIALLLLTYIGVVVLVKTSLYPLLGA